jgi:hypothetical protein
MKRLLLALLLSVAGTGAWAQGVTTAVISGAVNDQNGQGLPGANVVAVHLPSGTQYGTSTSPEGRFTIPGVRIGGPYKVTVTYVGYQEYAQEEIYLSLGQNFTMKIALTETGTQLGEVTVSSLRGEIISSDRTGPATNIRREVINTLPTLSRSINDFTRLTPQASGRSFVGQDARFNNITIDGSILNSSFGLADQPGGRTGSTPISLDAIEEIQVSIAPFDVRYGGFVGAGVNAVTRSGTNEFSGSVFYNTRNESLVGDKAEGKDVITANFNVNQFGFRVGGPIMKNKLFFFANAEFERRADPATSFTANAGGEPVTGNKTRVLRSDLDALSSYLLSNYNYVTGPYENYDNELSSDKFLVKLDYNISRDHKLSVRYNSLKSSTDVLTSNSSSLGFGARRSNNNALNYQNSNYIQNENIQSVIAELNSTFGGKFSNQVIAGYTFQNEDRGSRGDFFPLTEIQNSGTTYITFGFEPFTPNNKLEYKTLQFQDNFTYYMGKHTLTAGINFENFEFRNVFFPGSQSVYVFNSLADFYTSSDNYLNSTTVPVTTRRFQLRYSALPGGAEPVQPSEVLYWGVYLQDEFEPKEGLKVIAGVRMDVPSFKDTGYDNPTVSTLSFFDPMGNPYSINTAQLPKSSPLISPRIGFNWDVMNDKNLQVRGGSGLFTGRPAFVWISNQIGNNGVLTGFEQLDNTSVRPFNPDPGAYIPASPTAPTSVEIAATDPDFKFPQTWRSNIAVDKRLPWGLIGTLEYIYSQDVNAMSYFNANLPPAQTTFGPQDGRMRWTDNRYNDPPTVSPTYTITSAEVLTNTKKGYSYAFTAKIEKPFVAGFFGLAAYNYGRSKNTIDPGSIARGTWTNNPIFMDPNRPTLEYANNDQTHRAIISGGYRKEYGGKFASQASIFWEGRTQGRYNYRTSNDMNNDGGFNDLIYIANDPATEMVFESYDPDGSGPAVSYTAAEQAADWAAFISQDEYLNSHRGEYMRRNGSLMPWVFRADFSFVQEFFMNFKEKRNTLQLRVDIINVGNLISDKWGVGDAIVTTTPLNYRGVDGSGNPRYRLNTLSVASDGTRTPFTSTYTSAATLTDVYQIQLGLRYIFN